MGTNPPEPGTSKYAFKYMNTFGHDYSKNPVKKHSVDYFLLKVSNGPCLK